MACHAVGLHNNAVRPSKIQRFPCGSYQEHPQVWERVARDGGGLHSGLAVGTTRTMNKRYYEGSPMAESLKVRCRPICAVQRHGWKHGGPKHRKLRNCLLRGNCSIQTCLRAVAVKGELQDRCGRSAWQLGEHGSHLRAGHVRSWAASISNIAIGRGTRLAVSRSLNASPLSECEIGSLHPRSVGFQAV